MGVSDGQFTITSSTQDPVLAVVETQSGPTSTNPTDGTTGTVDVATTTTIGNTGGSAGGGGSFGPALTMLLLLPLLLRRRLVLAVRKVLQ